MYEIRRDKPYLVFDVTKQGLELFFELPSDPCTCHYGGQVYRQDTFVLEGLWNWWLQASRILPWQV